MQACHCGVGCGRTVTLRAQIQVDWVVLFGVILEASPFLRTSCGVLVMIRRTLSSPRMPGSQRDYLSADTLECTASGISELLTGVLLSNC